MTYFLKLLVYKINTIDGKPDYKFGDESIARSHTSKLNSGDCLLILAP